MIFIELLWESFDVKEGGPSGTWFNDLRLSVPTLLPTEISVRQWNWSIREGLYSLYSLYSGIHTVIELLDIYLPVLRNAFRIIVGLLAYQLGGKVPLHSPNLQNYISALQHFSPDLLTIIYIFGNSLSECCSMIFIELLWEGFDVKESGPSGTWTHDLRLSVPTLLSTEHIGPTMELKHSW